MTRNPDDLDPLLLIPCPDLKASITTEGVWRIRRQERSSVIEIWKMEETGFGHILSSEFVDWRLKMATDSVVGGGVDGGGNVDNGHGRA